MRDSDVWPPKIPTNPPTTLVPPPGSSEQRDADRACRESERIIRREIEKAEKGRK